MGDEEGKPIIHKQTEEKPHRRITSISWWVPISFATTGLLIGFVAGESQTAIVGTLLPLLFGVVGGGAGFFAVQRSQTVVGFRPKPWRATCCRFSP